MTTMEARLAAYTKASELLPDNASEMAVARLAEWLLTGTIPLDPARIRTAARALVDVSEIGHDYDDLPNQEQVLYEGRAARVVVAYLRDDQQ